MYEVVRKKIETNSTDYDRSGFISFHISKCSNLNEAFKTVQYWFNKAIKMYNECGERMFILLDKADRKLIGIHDKDTDKVTYIDVYVNHNYID